MFESSLKIARAFRRVQFERIFKYHEQCKSLIARAFILSLIYYMTGKITNAGALICTAVQIKILINDKLACSQPITMN